MTDFANILRLASKTNRKRLHQCCGLVSLAEIEYENRDALIENRDTLIKNRDALIENRDVVIANRVTILDSILDSYRDRESSVNLLLNSTVLYKSSLNLLLYQGENHYPMG